MTMKICSFKLNSRCLLAYVSMFNFAGGNEVLQYMTATMDNNGFPSYNCTLCGKSTKERHNMKRHIITRHTNPSREVCKYCNKVFNRKLFLERHLPTCYRNIKF